MEILSPHKPADLALVLDAANAGNLALEDIRWMYRPTGRGPLDCTEVVEAYKPLFADPRVDDTGTTYLTTDEAGDEWLHRWECYEEGQADGDGARGWASSLALVASTLVMAWLATYLRVPATRTSLLVAGALVAVAAGVVMSAGAWLRRRGDRAAMGRVTAASLRTDR